jgi:hypothetical protein
LLDGGRGSARSAADLVGRFVIVAITDHGFDDGAQPLGTPRVTQLAEECCSPVMRRARLTGVADEGVSTN